MLVKTERQIFADRNINSMNANKITELNFDEICDYTENVAQRFKSFVVINEKRKPHFKIDEEFRVIYKTSRGEVRCADITEYAFSQLCAQLGLPASYVKKCFENDKIELALTNFRAWSGEIERNLVFKEYQGVIRGVVTEHYKPFTNRQVCDTLRKSVDLERYMPVQANIQPESLNIRFIEREKMLVEGDKSPIWNGFQVGNNDVGGGALSIKDFMYRQWCTNGMSISIFNGTALRQSHKGINASNGKIVEFTKIINGISEYKNEKIKLIGKSANKVLDMEQYKMFIERVSANLRLSENSENSLVHIINQHYANNGNGLTEWSVINGITQFAQQQELEKRLDMEQYAGKLLTSTR